MRWPWSRPEKRQTDYSDEVVSALLARAAGATAGDPSATGALEACASLYSMAFAASRVSPDTQVTRALSPSWMALTARRLIRYGESVDAIQVDDEGIRLEPCGTWDLRGGPDESSWTYRVDRFGPSQSRSRLIRSPGVVHTRFSTHPARPWRGVAPLDWARLSGKLAANAELRLGEEAGGAVGHLIPVPDDGGADDDADPLETLRADIASLKGETSLVETVAAGWGEGRTSAAPMKDWEPRRIGANPPDAMVKLRWDSALMVANACMVPVSLLTDADGTSQRESWRRFVMGGVEPLSRIVAQELRRKLDVPSLSFDFAPLWAHDLAGRAAAFQKMIGGGMVIAEAASLSGLTTED